MDLIAILNRGVQGRSHRKVPLIERVKEVREQACIYQKKTPER